MGSRRVGDARSRKASSTKMATVTAPARLVLAFVTGPRQMQWGLQFAATTDNACLVQMQQRCLYVNPGGVGGTQPYKLVEGREEGWLGVRI